MRSPLKLPNLTQYERLGINQELNLADGHAHQQPDQRLQETIINRLPELYRESELIRPEVAEAEFREAFYELAGQYSAVRRTHTLLCSSASQSIDIIAAFLSAAGSTVGLLQPCFDNLAGILRRRGVRLVPVGEAELAEAPRPGIDALFVTLPNNPTGFSLEPAEFDRLARRCAAAGTTLVIDWTFRFFDRRPPWDQYAVLSDTGVRYLCVEDTGKTFPTQELKCGILAASADLFPRLVEPHNDLLLNVSPFVLRLLRAHLTDARQRGLEPREIVRTNRQALHAALGGSVLVPDDPDSTLSVAWIGIDSAELNALDVVALLGNAGIAVLPGDHFFWHDPDRGTRHVRFALARDTALFATACRRLRAVIDAEPLLRAVQ